MLLSQEAGWNQTVADWGLFLKHGAVFGAVAGERLVGTAAALPYGPALGWVSMVLVTPDWRGRGIATRLAACCTALLQASGRAPVLDATEAGTAVYARLGYLPLGTMQRLSGPGGAAKPNGAPPGPISDLATALALDREAFGADRGFLLRAFMARPGTRAVMSPSGLAVLRQGARACQAGPVIAGPEEAPGLLAAAVGAVAGPVILDLLQAGEVLLPALLACGFQPRRRFVRMALNCSALPGMPARMLAAAGPEFG